MYRIFSLAIIPALLIGITLFVVLIVRAEIAPSSSVEAQSGERRIVFTEKGFVPNVLTISEGEEVVFSSELSRSFWPASDIHPTHGIYPEFDPRRPLRKDEEWTMRFDKTGEWVYHDHLSAGRTGVIIVRPRAEGGEDARVACEKGTTSGSSCWNLLFKDAME